MTDIQNKMCVKFCVKLENMAIETYEIPESALGEVTI
jgi:hypothetical protein